METINLQVSEEMYNEMEELFKFYQSRNNDIDSRSDLLRNALEIGLSQIEKRSVVLKNGIWETRKEEAKQKVTNNVLPILRKLLKLQLECMDKPHAFVLNQSFFAANFPFHARDYKKALLLDSELSSAIDKQNEKVKVLGITRNDHLRNFPRVMVSNVNRYEFLKDIA